MYLVTRRPYEHNQPLSRNFPRAALVRSVRGPLRISRVRFRLNRAKAKVIGQKKIARQDLGAYAMGTALDELYGLGYNYNESEDKLYLAVTLEAVKAAARKYLRPDACVVATVAPAQA